MPNETADPSNPPHASKTTDLTNPPHASKTTDLTNPTHDNKPPTQQTTDPTNPAFQMITTLTSENPSATFGLGILTIPDATTRDEWRDFHRSILLARASSGRWLRQSRDWASDRFGVEFVAESEVFARRKTNFESKRQNSRNYHNRKNLFEIRIVETQDFVRISKMGSRATVKSR
jgi:hypothetical protein